MKKIVLFLAMASLFSCKQSEEKMISTKENPSENEKIAKEQFKEFMLMEDEKEYLDYKNSIRKTDAEVVDEIKNFLNGEAISVLQKMDRTERNEIIKRIKKIEGASERQIARVTGLTPNQIFKA